MNPITLPVAELKPALIGLGKIIQQTHDAARPGPPPRRTEPRRLGHTGRHGPR